RGLCRRSFLRRSRRARTLLHVAGALDLDTDQLRAHRDGVAGFPCDLEHLAGNGRGNLDVRLVGHHIREALLRGDGVARLYVPGDELLLGDSLADIGHADHMDAHRYGSMTRLNASPM